MDALADYRRASGLPGLSINWGLWKDAGMATSLGNRHQARLAAQGIESIPLEQGLQILGNLLGKDTAQVGVLPVNWSKFCQQIPQGVVLPFLESFIAIDKKPLLQRTKFLQQLEIAPVNERQTLLIAHIQTELVKLLGIDSSELEPQQGFLDLGMDSLMAVELKNRLESTLSCSLPATLVFDYPTIEALVDYLLKEAIAAFSDESAMELEGTNYEEQVVAKSYFDDLSDSEAEALLLGKLESMRY